MGLLAEWTHGLIEAIPVGKEDGAFVRSSDVPEINPSMPGPDQRSLVGLKLLNSYPLAFRVKISVLISRFWILMGVA